MILAAGALATPRLLLRSGVGPRGRESEMLPEGAAPFAIDNPCVGVGVFDHVISLVAWDYSGPIEYQAYDYGDFAAVNHADLERYLAGGNGPYAQYRPVSILDYAYGGAAPGTPRSSSIPTASGRQTASTGSTARSRRTSCCSTQARAA